MATGRATLGLGLGLLVAGCLGGGSNPVAAGRDLSVELVCKSCGVGRYTISVGGLAGVTVAAASLSTGQPVTCSSGTWSSDAVNVATVVGSASSGTVRGVGPGEARIRVELHCGAYGDTTAETEFLIISGEPAT